MVRTGRLSVWTAVATLALLSVSRAQIIPAVGLTAEVLGGQETPVGTTVYGTPRTFSATVANFGTATAVQGNLTFFAGATPICTAPLLPDSSVLGTTVSLNDLNPTLAIGILNAILAGTPGVLPAGNILYTLGPLISKVLGLGQTVVNAANLPAVLTAVGANTVTVNAGVIATCTTATIPVGSYPGVTVAYADLNVGGKTVSLNPLINTPLLSPTATLALAAFDVIKAQDTVSGTNPAPALPGATTPLTATVTNANAPPSILPPDGGNVTALLNGVPIGSGPITSSTGTTATFTFPITVPAGTTPGPKAITLQYSGTANFNSSTSGLNGSPAGPTLTVPYVPTLTGMPTPSPAPAGTPVSVAGTATTPGGGPAPTGSVTLTVNGVTTGPFILTTPATGSVSTFTGSLTAPNDPTGSPFPVTINYTPGSPAFATPTPAPTFPLLVGPATATVTATATPTSPAAGTPVTVTGTVTGSNGLPPSGTVNIQANGTTVGTATVNLDGTFTGSFVPTTPGTIIVTAVYVPSATSTVGPGTSPPTTITVVPSTATVTTTVAPNPTAPNGTVIASGTVTTTSGSPGGGTVTVTIGGQPVGTGTVGSDGKFSIPFTAPGAPGNYTVVTSFTPIGGSAPTGGGSASLTVSTTGTDSITSTISPNPGSPGGSETASGTVTTGTGSPAGGTVTVTINGQTVGTATVGADGKFNIPFTAPTAPGTYTVITSFTPLGASAPTAVVSTTFVVGSSTGITISFGNGGTGGFAFPNCVGPLTVTVSGSGSPPPTGNVTLQISGGKLGNNAVNIGTASFANGVATFNLESLKVKTELLNKFITHLGKFKTDLTKDNILDYSLLPTGDFLLLPGEYTLTALYPGDSTYGPASGSAPFNIDPLCLLVALTLKA